MSFVIATNARVRAGREADADEWRGRLEVHGLDLRDLRGVETFCAFIADRHEALDILVNNAGLALGTEPVWSTSIADVQQMIGTNVTALIALTTAVLPGMRARGKGHVINISSIAGHEAYAGGSVYCASKFAVSAYTTAARHDLVETPIRVTQISPAAVNTEFSTVRFGAGSGGAEASSHPTSTSPRRALRSASSPASPSRPRAPRSATPGSWRMGTRPASGTWVLGPTLGLLVSWVRDSWARSSLGRTRTCSPRASSRSP